MRRLIDSICLLPFLVLFIGACNTGPAERAENDSNVSVNIENDAVNVPVDKVFAIAFNAGANVSSVTSNTFFLVREEAEGSISLQDISQKAVPNPAKCVSANAVAATITQSGSGACDSTFTLTPTSSLSPLSSYNLCATSDITFCDPGINGFFQGLMRKFTTATTSNTYNVGGTISGLGSGKNAILKNNGGDSLTVASNGTFTFSTKLTDGSDYAVTVSSQPIGQTCTVTNGTGTVHSADVTNVTIACVATTYTVGGTASGIEVGDELLLQNNSGDDLTVTANGSFTFATSQNYGSTYDVSILTNPTGKTCLMENGSGTVLSNVTDISVTCSANTYTISGTVSGLAEVGDTVVIQNNGGDDLSISENGEFTFPVAIAYGSTYNVTVFDDPSGKTCSVGHGSGTVTGNVTDVAIACSAITYTIGGTMSGLGTGKSAVLQNNGGDNLTVSANGSFTFATAVSDGSWYEVTINTQPIGQFCTITSGSGTVSGANVTNISATCEDALTGNVTISNDTPMQVAVNGEYIAGTRDDDIATNDFCEEGECSYTAIGPFSPGGIPLSATGTPIAGSGSGLTPTNITDTTTEIAITVSYDGPEELDGCSVESPFSSIECLLENFSFTREELSAGISGTAASFIVDAEKTEYRSKASNSLTSYKYTTTQVSNIFNGNADAPQYLTVYNDGSGENLYFSAKMTGHRTRLFKYDRTYNNIAQISLIYSDGSDAPINLVVYNGALYFSAHNNSDRIKLFKYDGSYITQISNFRTAGHDDPQFITEYNGALYFSAYDNSGHTKLFKYDSSTGISSQISNYNELEDDSPTYLTVYDGSLYFSARPPLAGTDTKLMKYDSTSNTTTQISNINASGSDNISNLIVYNNALYFSANHSAGITKLYRYNGSIIEQISDTNHPQGEDPGSDSPQYLTIHSGSLYLSSKNSSSNAKIYRYDGISFTEISNTSGGNADNPEYLTSHNCALYFGALNAAWTPNLYKYDDVYNNIVQISASRENPKILKSYNGVLYLSYGGMMTSKLYKFE